MVSQPLVHFSADTVVVITGCSRGLGLEFVKQILETTESHVVATARKSAEVRGADWLVKSVRETLTLDTEDEASIKVWVLESCCRITVKINFATARELC